MKIKKTKMGLISYIEPEIPIAKEWVEEFKKVLEDCFKDNEFKIVINFHSVPYIDSDGLDVVKEDELLQVLSKQMDLPHIWLRKGLIDPMIIAIVPAEKARLYKIMPMFKVKNNLIIATSDPQAIFVFDEIEEMTGLSVQPVLSRSADIDKEIEEYYGGAVEIPDYVGDFDEGAIRLVESQAQFDFARIEEMADGSPIINFVNMIKLRAIKDKASDIHIEPDKKKLRVRYRGDGIMI